MRKSGCGRFGWRVCRHCGCLGFSSGDLRNRTIIVRGIRSSCSWRDRCSPVHRTSRCRPAVLVRTAPSHSRCGGNVWAAVHLRAAVQKSAENAAAGTAPLCSEWWSHTSAGAATFSSAVPAASFFLSHRTSRLQSTSIICLWINFPSPSIMRESCHDLLSGTITITSLRPPFFSRKANKVDVYLSGITSITVIQCQGGGHDNK